MCVFRIGYVSISRKQIRYIMIYDSFDHSFAWICFLQGSCTTGQIIVIVLVQTILAKNVSFQCFPCLPRSKCSRLMRSGDGLLPTDGFHVRSKPCLLKCMGASMSLPSTMPCHLVISHAVRIHGIHVMITPGRV